MCIHVLPYVTIYGSMEIAQTCLVSLSCARPESEGKAGNDGNELGRQLRPI